MGSFGLIEDQSCRSILNHCRGLIVFDGRPARKSIAVVQPRNDKGLDKKLRSMLCQEGPDFSDVV